MPPYQIAHWPSNLPRWIATVEVLHCASPGTYRRIFSRVGPGTSLPVQWHRRVDERTHEFVVAASTAERARALLDELLETTSGVRVELGPLPDRLSGCSPLLGRERLTIVAVHAPRAAPKPFVA